MPAMGTPRRDQVGHAVALSARGDAIAVGAPGSSVAATTLTRWAERQPPTDGNEARAGHGGELKDTTTWEDVSGNGHHAVNEAGPLSLSALRMR